MAIIAILVALLTFGAAHHLRPTPDSKLLAGNDFTIASAITESPVCSGGPALLYPGVTRCLTYTIANPLTVPITVHSIALSLDAAAAQPVGCPASNLDLTQTSFSGSLVVPAFGTNTINKTISLVNAAASQDGCKNVTFHFTYAGTATYVQAFSTNTAVLSSLSPTNFGQNVTFTATVSAAGAPPSGPTGTVTFFDGLSAVSGAIPVNGSGQAQFSTSTLTVGTHPIKAIFSNSDGNFSGSESATVNQVVNYTSCISENQNSNLTVLNGQAICISSSGKVNGSATVQSGGFLYVNGGAINGPVTVNANGGLFVSAGSSIGGVSATSPQNVSICGAKKVNGPISVLGSTHAVLIGDGTSGCAANDVNGSITLTSNTGGYKVFGNKINGGVTVTSNAGPGVIAGNNKINGNLACSGNNPAPTNGGVPNSVSGSRTGQCAGF
jgi:hypothetical protein